LGRVPQIALSIWVKEEKLCCLIADNSNGFKPGSNAAVVEKSKGPVWERGLGWFIMQASTDDMQYRPLGNQGFEMTFSIHNEDVPEDTSP
jgi:anti-sigma regulatory factor (Ser/Thr protein kinase)